MELAKPDAKLTPAEKRAMAQKNEAAKIRRKYKKDVHKHVKLLPVEQQYVGHMVVVLKVAGYSRTQIAKIAGVSKGQVKTYLEDPQITEMIEILRANLPAAAIDLMQGYLLEGVLVLVEVMRSESGRSREDQGGSGIVRSRWTSEVVSSGASRSCRGADYILR
jgi:hypothetical protein